MNVADEEDGSAEVGMNWLVTERPDIATDFALNEGGGLPFRLGDGRLVVEAFVPPPGGEGEAAVSAVEPRHIGLDEVVLTVSRLDPASRTITGQHLQITEGGVRLRPWVLHYASPEGLDGLAAEAGLRLVERHAGWRGEPFTPTSESHVSLYARDE